jgi:hypothetical protein
MAATAGKKSPSRELGGLGLGLLAFETETPPVTVDITIYRRMRFPQPPKHIVAR